MQIADESSAFVPFSDVVEPPAEVTVKCEVVHIAGAG